jgi:hypothetical protein
MWIKRGGTTCDRELTADWGAQSVRRRRVDVLSTGVVDSEVICDECHGLASPVPPDCNGLSLIVFRVADPFAGPTVAMQGKEAACQRVIDGVQPPHCVHPPRYRCRPVVQFVDDIHVELLAGFLVVFKPSHAGTLRLAGPATVAIRTTCGAGPNSADGRIRGYRNDAPQRLLELRGTNLTARVTVQLAVSP